MPTDMARSYGGGMQFAANGDIQLVTDTPTDPACTRQHIIFLVLTNPRLIDVNGNPISPPDSVYFPDLGAGLRAIIGKKLTTAVLNDITARVTAALAQFPDVAATPVPTVTATQTSRNAISLTISAYTASGTPIVIPSIDISALTAGA
jgi:hypothetical protein